MSRNKIIFMMFAAGLAFSTIGTSWAVWLEVNLESEGEPVPNTTVSFETEDGETIDVTLVPKQPIEPSTGIAEELEIPGEVVVGLVADSIIDDYDEPKDDDEIEHPKTSGDADGDKTAEDATGLSSEDQAQITTDESGKLAVNLSDNLMGKSLFVVIKSGGRVVKREKVALVNQHNRLKVVVPAVDFAVTKSQEKKCKVGVFCRFDIILTNHGLKTYKGPLVISNDMPAPAAVPGKQDEWLCSRAKRGQTLCVLEAAEIAPGASVYLPLTLKMQAMPNVRNRDSCTRVLWPVGNAILGEDHSAVQLLQLGANLRGYNAGRPDGIIGRRTRAAFAQLLESADIDSGQMTMPNLIAALGWDNLLLTTPMLSDAKACQQIKLVYVKTPRRPIYRNGDKRRKQSDKDSRLLRNIAIGVGIYMLKDKHKDKRKYKKKEHHLEESY